MHDAAGRVLTQTEANGLVTRYGYDARGRLLSETRGSETTAYTYTPTGQLASATLPSGYQVSYGYDAAQRLVSAQDNRGAVITYTLDAAGNRTREEVKDSGGNIALATTRVVNQLNRVTAIQGALGQTTTLGYDANGELVSQTDALQHTTAQTLDGLRRPRATTFPDNLSASQAWNALDQLTQVQDPKGVATQYTYNAFGDVLSETSPDIGTIQYTRDAAGEVTRIEDAKGQIARIERDALGRPTLVDYDSGPSASFSYDAAGFVTQIVDPSGSTTYSRDNQGRILSKTQTLNDNPGGAASQHRLTYSYAGGELASITYPSGLQVSYQRTAGRITGIQVQTAGKAAVAFVSGLSHTPLGQPKAWSWSSGDAASRRFDSDGRMTASEFASYGWDAASRITSLTQQLWAQKVVDGVVQLYQHPLTWSVGYDRRNRLTSFVRAGAESRYSYDGNSNRLTALEVMSGDVDLEELFTDPARSQSAAQTTKIEGSSNRLLGFSQTLTTLQGGQALSTANTTVTYAIDANGAMTSDGLRDFDYDASGRLAKVRIMRSGEAASITYLHNALGQRVFKGEPRAEQTLPNEEELGNTFVNWLKKNFGWLFTKGNQVSYGDIYVYGDGQIPSWALMGEYDNGSAVARDTGEYIWLPTEDGSAIPIGMYRGGKLYAIHADHLGTPRLITNQENKPVWQWPYSAFGNSKPTGVLNATTQTNGQVTLKGTKPPVATNLRFPGQYFDEESNLVYNRHRFYRPPDGRYTQFDPIGLAGGPNGFIYAGANPLLFADPMGLKHKANSAYCKDLRRKIDNLKKDLDKRWTELADDPLGLPERLGPGEKLSETKRGHRTLINTRDRNLRDVEKKYAEDCEQDNNDEGGGSCNECTAGAVAATMVGGYLVYRCVRMLPSLLPPLWPTIPANLALP